MELFDRLRPSDLERRERQLTIFASVAIAILGLGTALLMYPLVFSQPAAGNRMLRVGFFGFCSLSLLLSIYLWDRQRIVQRLRREVAVDRMRAVEAQAQASSELLKTMPNMSAFQDRLPMEYRRMASTTQKLSIVLAMVNLPAGAPESERTTILGDAAKAISRRLGEHDSLYVLSPTFFAAVLPGKDLTEASSFSSRASGGLNDVAGASNRFTFQMKIINYPKDASSAHELEQAVCSLIPADSSVHELAQAIV